MSATAEVTEIPRRKPAMPNPAKSLAEASDAELLDATGQRQDRAAFTELYARHKDSAYGLIFHIVRDHQRAEDALQDAYLNVWRHAGGLRDQANVRGWILRIAANEALRTVKTGRHARRTLALDAERHEAAPPGGQGAAPVDPELAAALNAQFEKLEPEQRNLIALYYAGGLSQREIGEALDITQQAISRKMTAALEALRRGLSQTGYAAALPLLDGGGLAEALGAQHPAPDALAARMLRALDAPAEASRRAAAASSGSGALIAAAVIVCAASASGVYLYLGGSTQSASAQSPKGAETPEGATTQSVTPPGAPPASPRFRGKWNLNDAKQLDELFGPGHGLALAPNEGPDGTACLDTGSDQTLRYFPGLPKLQLPIRARWREKLTLTKTVTPPTRVFVSWTDESFQTLAIFRNAGVILTTATHAIPWRRSEIYLAGQFSSQWLDGKLTSVEYFDLAPNPRLIFIARGRYLFDDFEIEEISAGDVPDLSAYEKAIAAIPPERRTGRIQAPGLASPRKGEQVFIEFLKSPAMEAAKKSER